MPLLRAIFCRIAAADGRHVEACLLEGVINLLSHLKAVETDARSYLCYQRLGASGIGAAHGGNGVANDAADRASPSGMNGTDGFVLRVVKQEGDAVGGADTNAHSSDVGHQGVDAFQGLLAFLR